MVADDQGDTPPIKTSSASVSFCGCVALLWGERKYIIQHAQANHVLQIKLVWNVDANNLCKWRRRYESSFLKKGYYIIFIALFWESKAHSAWSGEMY